jgi:hypothetical protein
MPTLPGHIVHGTLAMGIESADGSSRRTVYNTGTNALGHLLSYNVKDLGHHQNYDVPWNKHAPPEFKWEKTNLIFRSLNTITCIRLSITKFLLDST